MGLTNTESIIPSKKRKRKIEKVKERKGGAKKATFVLLILTMGT